MANFTFTDNTTSVTIIKNNFKRTYPKNVLWTDTDSENPEICKIILGKDPHQQLELHKIDVDKDNITGTGAGSTTGAQLQTALDGIFFLASGGGGSTAWGDITGSLEDQTDLWDALKWHAVDLSADQFRVPNNSGWAVNDFAPLTLDPDNTEIAIREFDDTDEEGIGFELWIPESATKLIILDVIRAETAPGSTESVLKNLYFKQITTNVATPAWSSAIALTASSIPTNTRYQVTETELTLASESIDTNKKTFLQYTVDNGGTNLPDSAFLCGLYYRFE